MGDHLIEPYFARIALCNCVGRQQSSGAAALQQSLGSEEEVRHIIGAATLPSCNVLNDVIAVGHAKGSGYALTANERRISDDRIESVPIYEHLRKF
jgi:hypothetical protein